MTSVAGLDLKSFEEVTLGYDPFYGMVMFNGFAVDFFLQDNYFAMLKFYLLISLSYVINFFLGGVATTSPFYLWLNQEISTTRLVEPLMFVLGIVFLSSSARAHFNRHFTGTVLPHPLYDRNQWQTSFWLIVDTFAHPTYPYNARRLLSLAALLLYNLSTIVFLWRTTATPGGFVYVQDNSVGFAGGSFPWGAVLHLQDNSVGFRLGSFPWGAVLHLVYGAIIIVGTAAATFPIRPPQLSSVRVFAKFYLFLLGVHSAIFFLVIVHLGSTFFQLLLGSIFIFLALYISAFEQKPSSAKSKDASDE